MDLLQRGSLVLVQEDGNFFCALIIENLGALCRVIYICGRGLFDIPVDRIQPFIDDPQNAQIQVYDFQQYHNVLNEARFLQRFRTHQERLCVAVSVIMKKADKKNFKYNDLENQLIQDPACRNAVVSFTRYQHELDIAAPVYPEEWARFSADNLAAYIVSSRNEVLTLKERINALNDQKATLENRCTVLEAERIERNVQLTNKDQLIQQQENQIQEKEIALAESENEKMQFLNENQQLKGQVAQKQIEINEHLVMIHELNHEKLIMSYEYDALVFEKLEMKHELEGRIDAVTLKLQQTEEDLQDLEAQAANVKRKQRLQAPPAINDD